MSFFRMKQLVNILSTTVAATAVGLASVSAAHSASISGQLGLTGSGPARNASVLVFDPTPCSSASCWKGLDFFNGPINANTQSTSGSFVGLAGDPFPSSFFNVTMNDTSFSTPGELFSIASRAVVYSWSSVALTYLDGSWGATFTGTMNGTGFDDTPYMVQFSSQGAGLTWSAETVPAPGVLALLGIGLVGMGVARRKTS
jgi:hypothetical protein